MKPRPPALLRLSAALLALFAASTPASAARYRVDLIVFADLSSSNVEAPVPNPAPDLGNAIELTDSSALRAAGIELLPEEQFALAEQWQRLRNSKLHRPLARIAWIQHDPPNERGPALRITLPASPASETGERQLDGSVALLLGRYLRLDARLRYLPSPATPEGYVLDERRKMRRDELHHLDGARLGVLARVTAASLDPLSGAE